MKADRIILHTVAALFLVARAVQGQILLSEGSYNQDFNGLANATGGDTNWTDNVTLPGWYAAQNSGGALTNYRVSTGSTTAGAFYSFGESGNSERALGSIGGGTPNALAYGVRFRNDTPHLITNITVAYTGEQWRRANLNAQSLAFSCCVSNLAITDADPGDAVHAWTPFPALDFASPNLGSGTSLIGNDPTNRQAFSGTVLEGIAVMPGEELFLRWKDADDSGSDHGLGIDDLSVTFSTLVISEVPADPILGIVLEGGDVVVTWTNAAYALEAAPGAMGPYTNVPGATSPHIRPAAEPEFYFRLKAN